MKKYTNIIFIVFLCCAFYIILFNSQKMKLNSAEDLDIYVADGVGIDKNGEGNINFRVSTSANEFKVDGGIESLTNIGIGSTIGKTREDRQKKIGKKFFLGLSTVHLIEEEYGRYGIRNMLDIVFKNTVFNDNAYLVVCKGRSEDYFNYISPGYNNSAEFISDMIKSSVNYNFFKDGSYMLKNIFVSVDAEGKNIAIPYIEIKKEGISVTGMAIFKKDKLDAVLDIKDTRIMNILRENKVKGMFTIQDESGKYVNYQAESKRKISCNKIGDKYTFIIDVNLNGEIISNLLYKDMASKIKVTKKFEKDMEKQVKGECEGFIDKMKNEYKVDCLQLGWRAAAKYGRDTGVDWNEVVSNSDIKVNVKVHVDLLGRGEY